MAVDLLHWLGRYDPARSQRQTFMARIVEHRLATLIQERQGTNERFFREPFDKTELSELPDPRVKNAHVLASEMDLNIALKALSPELRELWEWLQEANLQRISVRTGIARTTLFDRRQRLRKALRKAGI